MKMTLMCPLFIIAGIYVAQNYNVPNIGVLISQTMSWIMIIEGSLRK